jgi:hypothetical protein
MTLMNGARGPASAGGDDGGPEPAGAVPQSEIPTWSGPAVAPVPPAPRRPSGPIPVVPVGRPARPTPPSGVPSLPPLPRLDPGPSSGIPGVRPAEVPPVPAGWWSRTRAATRGRPLLRVGVIGVLSATQAFVLFSAVMWWLGGTGQTAQATVAPMTWTGVVYDVGTAGVNMRTNPAVSGGNGRDVAARGARLALQCGQTGDVVTREDGTSTATWLRTTDGLWVSMLYVHVPDRTSIPSCPGAPSDGPLLAVSDPTATEEPPRPGASLATDPSTANRRSQSSSDDRTSGSDQGSADTSAPPTTDVEAAAPPADGSAVGPSGVAPAYTDTTVAPPTTTPATGRTLGQGVASKHHSAQHRADPNITPVG